MDDQLKFAIAHHHNVALLRFMEARGVGIISRLGREDADLGSGTCIRIGGRHLIATAAHVIRGYSLEDLWIVHRRHPSDTQLRLIGRGCEGGGRNDPVDVGWLEIDPKSVSTMSKEFVSLEQLKPNCGHLGSGELAYLHGNPTERVSKEALERRQVRVQPVGCMTNTEPATSRNLDPGTDIVLAYPDRVERLLDGTVIEVPDAPGFSGGSIWTMNVNASGVWSTASCKLIGIEHAWTRATRWVRGTQIQHWMTLVAKDLPELAPIIQSAM